MTNHPSESFVNLVDKVSILRAQGSLEILLRELRDKYASVNKRKEFQRLLLERTFEYARANCAYYEEILPEESAPDISVEEAVTRIPLLTRSTLEQHLESIMSRISKPSVALWTSGTTGHRLCFYMSYDELKVRSKFGALAGVLSDNNPGSYPSGIVITIPSLYHGPIIYPEQAYTLASVFVAHTVEHGLDFLIEELHREHRLPNGSSKAATLICSSPKLKTITRSLLAQGIDPAATGIRTIHSFGYYVSNRSRQWLSKAWNAEVFDNYGLAEVSGGARDCEYHCGLHFGISVIPECVDPATLKPVSFGVPGVLLLTTLYPFQQTLPLLRYVTGDLVVLREGSCKCGYEGITMTEFKGKQKFSIRLEERQQDSNRYITPIDFYDVLEDFEEIEHPLKGFPKFYLSKQDGSLLIHLAISKKTSKRRKEEIRNLILTKMIDRMPSDLKLDVKFHFEPSGLIESYTSEEQGLFYSKL